MGILKNYEYVPEYSPDNRKEKLNNNTIPLRPYEEYDANGYLSGYYWFYGDSIILQFLITGVVVDEKNEVYENAGDYLFDKLLNFQIYDNMGNVVYEREVNGKADVSFKIEKEDSLKMIRGVYTCALRIITKDVNGNIEVQTTLYSPEDLALQVK